MEKWSKRQKGLQYLTEILVEILAGLYTTQSSDSLKKYGSQHYVWKL